MVRGIFWYLSFICACGIGVVVLVKVLPRTIGIFTGSVFLLSHYFAACTWLTLRFDLGMTGPVIYAVVLSIALVKISQSGPLKACIVGKDA
jgi:hypothetical protein